jgi:hypothetical protein
MFTVLNSIQAKKLKAKASTPPLLKEANVEFDANKLKLNKYSIYDYLDDQEAKDANNSQRKVVSLEKNSSTNSAATMETINDVRIFCLFIYVFGNFYLLTNRSR